MVRVVRPQPVARLELVHAPADELGVDVRADPRVLAPPTRAILGAIPLDVAVQVDDLASASSLCEQPTQREVDHRLLGPCDLLVSVRKLPEHPAGEHLLEPSVHDPARELRVDVAPEVPSSAWPCSMMRWTIAERLADLLHLRLELRAPGDLAHHHGHEVRSFRQVRRILAMPSSFSPGGSSAPSTTDGSRSSPKFSRKTVSSTSSFDPK